MARHFQASGHPLVAVTQDGSERARVLASAVGGATSDPVAADVVIVANGWPTAAATLRGLLALPGAATRAIVLPPWLLRVDLLSPLIGGPATGLVLIASPTDPTGPAASAYLAALAARAPRAEPTGAGLAGFLAANGASPPGFRLYAPAEINVLPAYLEPGHNHGRGLRWFAVGGLAPVSGLLR